jgi:hypothetical protein
MGSRQATDRTRYQALVPGSTKQVARQAKQDGSVYGVFREQKAALDYLARCLGGKRRTTLF